MQVQDDATLGSRITLVRWFAGWLAALHPMAHAIRSQPMTSAAFSGLNATPTPVRISGGPHRFHSACGAAIMLRSILSRARTRLPDTGSRRRKGWSTDGAALGCRKSRARATAPADVPPGHAEHLRNSHFSSDD
jgi:hypothetical protein